MNSLKIRFAVCLLFCFLLSHAQKPLSQKGKLLIIGGGERPLSLMKTLLTTAEITPKDYIVVLPMSSEAPDTSYWYFKTDMEKVCGNAVVSFNFTRERVNDHNWLDSLEHAKLIFITGGDQFRFMNAVLHTPVYKAIHTAYKNGSTIAGSSAGAAVMSRYMITGNQLTDTSYRSTFNKLRDQNIEISEGLGLLTDAIIDQHFITRSRYNRLLSALAKYPSLTCIGIDEETAIIVHGNRIKIAGEGQVVVIRKPEQLKITPAGLIKLKDVQFSIYTDGDEFFY